MLEGLNVVRWLQYMFVLRCNKVKIFCLSENVLNPNSVVSQGESYNIWHRFIFFN